MSKNRQNCHWVSITADRSLPEFHLAQRVQTETVLPHATWIQKGKVLGFEYFSTDSVWVAQHGIEVGWHYTIEVDVDDPRYAIDPFLHIAESAIEEVKDKPCKLLRLSRKPTRFAAGFRQRSPSQKNCRDRAAQSPQTVVELLLAKPVL